MSLEQVIQEQTAVIKALTEVLGNFKPPVTAPAEKTEVPAEKSAPAKVAPKAEPKAEVIKPKAKTTEAEQKEDIQAVLDEAENDGSLDEEEDEFALPKGKRDEAYIRLHIMPKLLDLAKATSKDDVLGLIGKFKTAAGAKVTKSTELQPDDLQKVVDLVSKEIAKAEAAKAEEV